MTEGDERRSQLTLTRIWLVEEDQGRGKSIGTKGSEDNMPCLCTVNNVRSVGLWKARGQVETVGYHIPYFTKEQLVSRLFTRSQHDHPDTPG